MILKKICLFVAFLTVAISGLAQEFPAKPNRLVNDYTNTLTSEQVDHLEHKLVAFDDSTSIQIAVAIIQSTGGYDIDDYGARLGENWGVGHQGKNNGIMLLVALKDRKVTIQTGYGLEGALPDAAAARIRLNEINPNFKQGRYFEGLDRATDAIIAYTKGEYKNEEPKRRSRKEGSGKFPLGLIIIIIVIIALISKGGGGRGGQVIGSRGGSSLFWWTLMSGMGNRGRGDGFGGGGGDGGSFGGFGGGSFGGGGSGGSW